MILAAHKDAENVHRNRCVAMERWLQCQADLFLYFGAEVSYGVNFLGFFFICKVEMLLPILPDSFRDEMK